MGRGMPARRIQQIKENDRMRQRILESGRHIFLGSLDLLFLSDPHEFCGPCRGDPGGGNVWPSKNDKRKRLSALLDPGSETGEKAQKDRFCPPALLGAENRSLPQDGSGRSRKSSPGKIETTQLFMGLQSPAP
jgi:hypothetical protein